MQDKISACLLGGAMGDAMGADIEFWSLDQIRRDGIRASDSITDDTQMTLFTAEGLIRARVRAAERGICAPEAVVHHALLRWYVTQGGRPQMQVCDRGLIADPRLHRRRAPGLTCVSALAEATRFGETALNDSKGCGTIMRVAPCALIASDVRQAEQLARDTSALTHGHVLGIEAAVAQARILFELLHGASLADAVGAVALSAPIMRALDAAMTAPDDGRPETVERQGAGWVAEEALSIAVYAARVGRDPDHGLRIAAIHSGDSDSTAAIAGNLLGLLHSQKVLATCPPLRERDLIEHIARDLALARADQLDPGLSARYPGW